MVRYKNRYLIANISAENQLETCTIPDEVIFATIQAKIQQLHGDFGVAAIKSGLRVQKISPNSSLIMIRSRHGPHRYISSSIPFIDKIKNNKVAFHSLFIGSTIKTCNKFLVKYHTQRINKDLEKFKDTAEFNNLLQSFK